MNLLHYIAMYFDQCVKSCINIKRKRKVKNLC